MTCLVAIGLVAAAVVALRPAAGRGPEPVVTGLSLHLPPPQQAGAATVPIAATYRVTSSRSGSSLRVRGLTGPYLIRSSVRTSSVPTAGDAQLVTVSAVADCRSPGSLGSPTGRYLLVARLTRLDGTTTGVRRRVPTSTVDWAAAVRQDCWQRVAARGIAVDDVVAGPGLTGPVVLIGVRLTSSLAMDVQVGAVDVADVSTFEAAETGTLPARGSLILHVRQPVRDCRAGPLPDGGLGPSGARAGLLWSVGPVGGDAAATFVTGLPAALTGAVRKSERRLCRTQASTSAR